MKADKKFLAQPLEFWANVKLISQKNGYTDRKTGKIKVHDIASIVKVFKTLKLDHTSIEHQGQPTSLGQLLVDYFQHRCEALTAIAQPNLMTGDQAKLLYEDLHKKLNPKCPIPLNKQKNEKAVPAYFTGIVNMLIEEGIGKLPCDYDPRELTAFTQNNIPVRSLSRRVDGSFPHVIDPISIWEIKEYYYTTTFGSRIADGVYETQLDGYELNEVRNILKRDIHHYLFVDAYTTWWIQGRSYLCRICDMLHMGLVTEVLFGKEVVTEMPRIIKHWVLQHEVIYKADSPVEREIAEGVRAIGN
jgi:hypothetical protein